VAAAAAEGLDRIDAATVERVWRELSPQAPGPAGAAEAGRDRDANDAPCEEPPRVRVVRRLWG